MRVLLSKLEEIEDDVADIKSGILKIQANVAFHGDDSSLVKLRPPFKSGLRADCSKIGHRETVKKQMSVNQPPGIQSTLQSTETALNSLNTFVTRRTSTSTSHSVPQSIQRPAELMVTVTSDKQPSASFIASREVLDHQLNWASRMSHSEDAEQTGNDVDSDVATDDQQGGSYSEVVGRRK